MAIFPSFGLDGEDLGGGGEKVFFGWILWVLWGSLSRSLNMVAKDGGSGKRGHGRMKDEEICDQCFFCFSATT